MTKYDFKIYHANDILAFHAVLETKDDYRIHEDLNKRFTNTFLSIINGTFKQTYITKENLLQGRMIEDVFEINGDNAIQNLEKFRDEGQALFRFNRVEVNQIAINNVMTIIFDGPDFQAQKGMTQIATKSSGDVAYKICQIIIPKKVNNVDTSYVLPKTGSIKYDVFANEYDSEALRIASLAFDDIEKKNVKVRINELTIDELKIYKKLIRSILDTAKMENLTKLEFNINGQNIKIRDFEYLGNIMDILYQTQELTGKVINDKILNSKKGYTSLVILNDIDMKEWHCHYPNTNPYFNNLINIARDTQISITGEQDGERTITIDSYTI